MATRVLVGTAILAFAAVADLSHSVGAAQAAAAAAQPRSAESQMGLRATGGGRMSLDVQGAEVRTVLRSISEYSGRNIVVGKDVKGLVSVQLKDVPWIDALTAVCRTQGLDFVDEGTVIRVDAAEKLQSETLARESNEARRIEVQPLVTHAYKLQYAKASEIQKAITSVLTKRGQVDYDERTNTLIITDIESKLGDAEAMAKSLDTKTPQIEITAKLVDINVSALKSLGVRWGVRNLDVGSLTNPSTDVDPKTWLTNPPNQSNQLGVDTPSDTRASTIGGVLTRPWGTVEFLLDQLESRNEANIISNPRITTVDNHEAKILVGQKIPLITQDVAGNAVTQLQTIGISLKVTPHLTEEKRIILDMHPEVSDLATQSTVQGGVIINTSEADTRVMVDDGQTAVIGGLIRTNESTVTTGVPILMNIPVLGGLFRSKSTVKQQRELVIFVTPKLVESFASNVEEPKLENMLKKK
jgi:type IV pilus assembly protein PilQ